MGICSSKRRNKIRNCDDCCDYDDQYYCQRVRPSPIHYHIHQHSPDVTCSHTCSHMRLPCNNERPIIIRERAVIREPVIHCERPRRRRVCYYDEC